MNTPRAEVGEPLVRFISLPNPAPQPAPADERMTFTVQLPAALSGGGASWSGALWLNGEGRPALLSAGSQGLRFDNATPMTETPATPFADLGADAVAAADLNYDFRTDLVVASGSGLQIFRQTDKGFTAVTSASRLPADVTNAPLAGVWAADIDTDGDLDLVVALRDAPPRALRNNGDGTFAVQSPFSTTARARGFAWADFDGEGVPDAALLDDQGIVRIYLNLRAGEFREQQLPAQFPHVAAITAADVDGDGIVDSARCRRQWHRDTSVLQQRPAGLRAGAAGAVRRTGRRRTGTRATARRRSRQQRRRRSRAVHQ